MISKDKVRKMALETRDQLEKDWRGESSSKIMQQLMAHKLYQQAEVILSYSAISSEVETKELNRRIVEDGKQLYLPRVYVEKKEMKFYQVESNKDLTKGYQGILEPLEKNPMETILETGLYPREHILMIMPGVTYDKRGNRMGYGGGYYDRYLQSYGQRLTSVLVVFCEQKSLIVPAEKCDIKPDYIMTQTELFQHE